MWCGRKEERRRREFKTVEENDEDEEIEEWNQSEAFSPCFRFMCHIQYTTILDHI